MGITEFLEFLSLKGINAGILEQTYQENRV